VASRGKLRGLSLPVAGTKKVEGPPSPQKTRKRQSASVSQHPLDTKATSPSRSSDPRSGSVRSNGVVFTDISNGLPSPYPPPGWDVNDSKSAKTPTFPTTPYSGTIGRSGPFTPPEATAILPSPQHPRFPPSQQPRPFSNHDRAIPLPYPATNQGPRIYTHSPSPYDSTPQSNYSPYSPFTPTFDTPFRDQRSFVAFPRPDESYVRNDAFEPPQQRYEQALVHAIFQPQQPEELEAMETDDVEEVQRQDLENECAIVDDASVYSAPLSLDFSLPLTPFSSAHGIGKTSRMQFLINYYAEVISPVIVAFDGPNNPYRTQILRLAQSSETLQHAISALAASNLRQRKETGVISTGKTDPARRSSMAHLTLTDKSWHSGDLLSPQEQAREETFHKNFAIQSLNQQLADPALRKNDSILAVLLILCLFHICDSGVAKFQTQFAGVKKLLSLRGSDLRLNTPETKWFTRMFTWFDAMTASVNDREGQLQGHHLDVSALSDEEWSLENLAGCDGQLFKTIAKLGRLNILSQGKSVESSPTLVCRPLPSLPFIQPGAVDYNNFDGNGWMRIIADEDLFTSKTSEPDPTSTEFWREWREIRQTLQMWQLDPTIFDAANPNAPDLTADQRIDLANISESFRYSALLYTERVANPSARSTDPSIQSWVRQSLEYIKQVKSDVYLLWPLFITGSECVEALDRAVIRERCLDIQKDSGFLNNKSCLDLIEKIWLRNPVGAAREEEMGPEERGFRFTRVMAMEGNEGEYIVV
jgi:Fungal specific transcription factor domain